MSERIYFSMRETIDATGVEAPTLRYWEKQFAQLSPRKDRHGNRYYTAEDIALIKRIRFIRDEMKITRIEAIRNELQSGERQTDVRSEAVERLTRIRSKLQEVAGPGEVVVPGFNHLPPATEFVPRQGCIVLPADGSRVDRYAPDGWNDYCHSIVARQG